MVTRSTAHVFVAKGDQILVLQHANGGWWECPGGTLEPGEDASSAATRETLEETGLRISDPVLLRRWSYRNRSGDEVECYAYAAEAPDAPVSPSSEHGAYQWLDAESYARDYCGEAIARLAPEWAREFLSEMRVNCARFAEWRRDRAG